MGLKTFTIYFDACLAIYLVEESQLFLHKLETELKKFSTAILCISPLTEMECLVLPLRQKDQDLVQKFRNWFASNQILPIGPRVFQTAAQLRADFPSLKTPDALHLATALHHKCDEFWTNDDRLDNIAPNIVKNIL